MKHSVAAIAFAVLVMTGGGISAVRADDEPPHRKPGMWDQTMAMPGGQKMSIQMCIDEETEKQFSALGRNRPGCTQEFHKIDGGYSFKGTCDGKTATGTAIGDFDKAIKVEVDAEGRHIESNLTYLGPCPADRKPGDMVMPGGQVMNMKDMPR